MVDGTMVTQLTVYYGHGHLVVVVDALGYGLQRLNINASTGFHHLL